MARPSRTSGPPGLHIRDLRVGGGEKPYLEIADLRVPPGAALGIRGPSGAGKSTLIMALAGLVPFGGEIRWGEMAITPQNAGRFRAASVGLVFQDFMLFEELGALENAALSALFAPASTRAGLRDRAGAALATFGVPGGGRRVASYSGGERQRIAVARALAPDPSVLLADEPTASLDRASADALIGDLVRHGRQGRTLVVASHDEALLSRMDRVIELVDGRPVGTPA